MIIRRRHTANFTTIGNVLFEDDRLALDEIGLMAWLLSRPNDWQVRRPALMRQFKIGRDGLRRVLRRLLRFGWIRAQVTRLSDGRVHVLYEVRDQPGPELSEDEARAALSLVSSGAGPGESVDDDGEGESPDEEPDGADPPSGYAQPPTGQPEAGSRLRLSPPGYKEELLKPDSQRTESPKDMRSFSDIRKAWPSEHMLSFVVCESLHAMLTDADKEAAFSGIKAYLHDRKSKSLKLCDLSTYYRERRWERFAANASAPSAPVMIKPYSPQWYRWREYRAATGQSIKFMEHYAQTGQGMWAERNEWPPALPARTDSTGPPTQPQEQQQHQETQQQSEERRG